MIYKPGSQPPSGYIEWFEWAQAQDDAGIKQQQCPYCNLWFYPQEKDKHALCAQHHVQADLKPAKIVKVKRSAASNR